MPGSGLQVVQLCGDARCTDALMLAPYVLRCKLTRHCAMLAGCSTPLHRDPYRNALCQVRTLWLLSFSTLRTDSVASHTRATHTAELVHNLQIKGSKHIELFHSDWCQQIYPFTTMVLRNTSQVRAP